MLILFVDDDPDDYELFYEALRSFNKEAKCLHALDGVEALNLLTNVLTVLPDFIILDVNMPKMGGKESLSKIKSDPRLKDIPVIVYSTSKNSTEIEDVKKLGAQEFIIKPGRFTELVDVLKENLK